MYSDKQINQFALLRTEGESDKMSYFCHIFERFFKNYVIELSST